MTLHPYEPVPWESFVVIPTPRARRRTLTFRAFAILAALAIVTGGLVAVSAL